MSLSISDLLFPKRCVSHNRLGSYFCQECISQIEVYQNQKCQICFKPSIDGITHPKCKTKLSIDGAISIFYFSGPVKSAIYKLKYHWISDLAGSLVDLALDKFAKNHFVFNHKFVITYVPLHQKRHNWRGFNQAELLALQFAKKQSLDFAKDLIVKTKDTKPQVELKKHDRIANVRNVFGVMDRDKIANADILVVDDLRTTGATLKNCALVLKRAGARLVWGLTIAAN